MLVKIRRSILTILCLSLLIVYCGCNACDNNKNHAGNSNSDQPKSFYARNNGSGRVIVFVHGIYGNSHDTWSCSPEVSWPGLLIGDNAFDDSDIYVAGYDTAYLGNRMTMDEVVSSLKSRLDSDEVFSRHREVVFVAHSLGGLVVQRLLLTHRELAQQVPFIYFYSTPETGSQIAQLANLFSQDPLLKEMLAGDSNDYLLNLESEWRSAHFGAHRYCAYEKKAVNGILVVDRLSGTRNCEKAVAINETHLTIVKPCNRSADAYIALRNAVKENPIAPEKIPMKAVTENRKWISYQEVGCNHTNSQTLVASVPLDAEHGERIVSISASLENTDNIQGPAGPTLGTPSGNTVPVKYGFNGKDKDFLGNCPGGGHATVAVTFVVEKQVPAR